MGLTKKVGSKDMPRRLKPAGRQGHKALIFRFNFFRALVTSVQLLRKVVIMRLLKNISNLFLS
jgi:hypothetical protein